MMHQSYNNSSDVGAPLGALPQFEKINIIHLSIKFQKKKIKKTVKYVKYTQPIDKSSRRESNH